MKAWESLKEMFYEDAEIEKLLPYYEEAVLKGELESFSAAGELLDRYRRR